MLVELGHFALVLALAFTFLQVILPTIGLIKGDFSLAQLSRPMLWAQFFWVLVVEFFSGKNNLIYQNMYKKISTYFSNSN